MRALPTVPLLLQEIIMPENVITASVKMNRLKMEMCALGTKMTNQEYDAFMDRVAFYLDRFEFYLKDVHEKLVKMGRIEG
jgi:hypothetical protein